jgi:hypothetical protein
MVTFYPANVFRGSLRSINVWLTIGRRCATEMGALLEVLSIILPSLVQYLPAAAAGLPSGWITSKSRSASQYSFLR